MEGLLADTSSADLSAIESAEELSPQGKANAESVELLREFERTGRAEPFEALMRRHAPMVFATCLKVTRDPHDAEDATQATFLTLAAKGKLNGEIRSPEAWLRKVAHRLSLDLIRSKKRRSNRETIKGEMVSEVQQLDSHDHADNAEAKRILSEELAKMPAGYRMPLVLHYFGGLSRDEMAAQLKVKPSTLGVRLHRAREQLRKRLSARGVAMPAAVFAAVLTDTVRGRITDALIGSTSVKASVIAMGGGSTSYSTGLSASALTSSFLPIGMTASVVRSVRSLLNSVLSSKIKLAGVLAITGTLISASTAKVIAYLPEMIRQIIPSFSAPTIPLPKFDAPIAPRIVQADKAAEPMPFVAGSLDAKLAALRGTGPAPVTPVEAKTVYAAAAASGSPVASTSFVPLAPTPVASTASLVASRPDRLVSLPSSASLSTSSFGSTVPVSPVARPAIAKPNYPSPAATPSTTFLNASLATVRSASSRSAPRRDSWNAPITETPAELVGSPIVRAGSDQPSALDIASPDTVGAQVAGSTTPGVRSNSDWSLAQADSAASSASAPIESVTWHAAPGGGVTASYTYALSTTDQTKSSTGKIGNAPRQSIDIAPPKDARPAAVVATDLVNDRVIRYIDASAVTGAFDLVYAEPSSLTDSSNSLGLSGFTSASFYVLRSQAVAQQSLDDAPSDVVLPPDPLGKPLGPNSARITLRGSTADAAVDYLDVSDASLPAFPPNHTFFGAWELQTSGTFDGVDLLVRYDDLRAARLGLHEYAVKLWVSDGTTWTNLLNDPTFGRDTLANLVWANYAGGDVRYFAVSTPEPAAMLVLGAAGAMALRRRRR